MENKNEIFDIIITLTKGIKESGDDRIQCNIDGKEYIVWKSRYLLNQYIRLYQIDQSHTLISKKAKEVWEKISNDDINNYYYQKIVKCENESPVKVKYYRGNENTFAEKDLIKGDEFHYRQVFHDEHIIPIKLIIDHLVKLNKENNLNYKTIEEVLNNIYVCKMLKEEDRGLNNKYNRPYNLDEIIEKYYKPAGIDIIK